MWASSEKDSVMGWFTKVGIRNQNWIQNEKEKKMEEAPFLKFVQPLFVHYEFFLKTVLFLCCFIGYTFRSL